MDPVKHGTCGEKNPCRFYALSAAGSIVGVKYVCHNKRGDECASDWWCGEWEPPEGKHCGNCEFQEENGIKIRQDGEDLRSFIVRCRLDGGERHESDSCEKWQWQGNEEQE